MKPTRDLLVLVALVLSGLVGVGIGQIAATGAISVDNASVSGNTFSTAASFPRDYYLHNSPTPPTGDTDSQAVLPLSTTSPTATTLYNYDQNRDAFPGLLVKISKLGSDETDLSKYQAWRSGVLSEAQRLIGTATIELWGAIEDFSQGKAGEVTIFLRDYNGSTYTEIGNGTAYDGDWQAGSTTWVKKTISISGLNYTISVGHELEVKLIVGTNAGSNMWFAYDTSSYPSVVKIPKVP